jgi:hypothetical protein
LSGELLIQLVDIARFQTIRPALDELELARTLGSEAHAVLREAAASPFARRNYFRHFAGLLSRILRHPELELRVFLAPREVDVVIEGVVHVLCFENGAEFSLVDPVGPNWVVLDRALVKFSEFNWFREIFLVDVDLESGQLAYPRRGELRYSVLRWEDVVRLAAGLRPLLEGWAAASEERSAAEGLAHLVAQALSENLTLAHLFLL